MTLSLSMFLQMCHGLLLSLKLTVGALLFGGTLALLCTLCLLLRGKVTWATMLSYGVKAFVTLFTGTPLLVQFYLFYFGIGQYANELSAPWNIINEPAFCAVLVLGLNTAAYSIQLFYGACKTIPSGQWQACKALGMTNVQTLQVILPYGLRRALPAYSNEVILIFKGTSLASTITLMDIMGYANMFFGQTYDVFGAYGLAGAFYLSVNGLLTILFRRLEKHALAFEQR
ncbi:Arginine ABC transporter permease protein ArtM [Vibrio stylophorae]|uniref:Arginine ABC transporter permease protein ArtM n=1 Tax=Vibrio stylophorae TaxID=659351 RepID=A0ABN8DW04_9VIBR|nr:arginine ABC transporter permease ArtM [Vibrio stylophorae]CAH0533532.1 Arginine ABC transporter permease protein ArtM [Vibrio stylophorae]